MRIKETLDRLAEIATLPSPTAAEQTFVATVIADNLCARFFFPRAKSAAWIESALTAIESAQLDEEAVWFRLGYVLRACAHSPDVLTEALLRIRSRLTGRMLYDVLKALLDQPPATAWALRGFVEDYIVQPTHIIATDLGAYLLHVAKFEGIDPAELCGLLRLMLSFRPNPETDAKTAQEDRSLWAGNRDPLPRFDNWEYQQIMENGVRGLTKRFPVQVAHALLHVLRDFLHLKVPEVELENGVRQDLSFVWCTRVDGPAGSHTDSDEVLVHTFTFACEVLFERSAEDRPTADGLDAALRQERWEVLDRIRFHCYAKFPAVAAEWIRAEIVAFPSYREGFNGYEFATMIRQAGEVLGETLLSREQRSRIFDEIVRGATDEELQERFGDKSSPERFNKYRLNFTAKHLWPFEPLLFGPYVETFRDATAANDPVTPDEFQPFTTGPVRTIESKSPVTQDKLAAMPDEELIAFLNEWETPGRPKKTWWIETNFEGLGNAFRLAVRADPARFGSFGAKWHQIKRPIYLRYVIDAAKDEVKAGQLERLAAWLKLCDWVADHECLRGVERKELSEASVTVPNWESARRAVVDFAAICVEDSTKLPLEWRSAVADLLSKMLTGFDSWLESGKPIVTPADPLTDAINTTRGRAIEAFAQFALWLRRASGEKDRHDSLREFRAVMERRFAGDPPLLPPEYAQLGRLFPLFLYLDEVWAERVRDKVFSQPGSAAWQSAFGTFVLFTQPNQLHLKLLRTHYEYALENPEIWPSEGRSGRDMLPRLGQHLFAYYVWGLIPLTGPDSLLERFYAATKAEIWAALMQHVGQSLKNTPILESALKERCLAFLEARLAVGNATELAEFTFWLEADSLDVTWRLRSFIATMNIVGPRNRISPLVVDELNRLLDQNADLVVDAFAAMVAAGVSSSGFYFDKKVVLPILQAGLASQNETTRAGAVAAQESLLRAGLFDYLQVPPSATPQS